MISQDVNRQLIQEIFDLYLRVESEMLQQVSNSVKTNIWQELKSDELTKLRIELQKTVKKTNIISENKIFGSIVKAYLLGFNSANMDLGLASVKLKDINIPSSLINLIIKLKNSIIASNQTILRRSLDVYREVIAEVSQTVLVGTDTRLEIAQNALNKFANNGITSFVDKSGRRWEMASYTEMATRTATGRASIQGHIDRQIEQKRDLVIVSDHRGECELCRPFEGKILSLTGATIGYMTLNDARAQGLFHPNCRHTITGYVQGLTKIEKSESDPNIYKTEKRQREIERQIRKWKRRLDTSITAKETNLSKSKIKEWQQLQRDLLENTDLRRKYNRESINVAR